MKKTKKNINNIQKLSFINGLILLLSISLWFIHENLVAIAAAAVLENTVGFTAEKVRSLAFTTSTYGLIAMSLYIIAYICNYIFSKKEKKKPLYCFTTLNIIFIIIYIVKIIIIFV